MPKESKYIVNKSNVLFDMHRQLADIKRGKAYREGDTAVGDAVQKSIDAFVARHNGSKKSPMRCPQLQLPMCLV